MPTRLPPLRAAVKKQSGTSSSNPPADKLSPPPHALEATPAGKPVAYSRLHTAFNKVVSWASDTAPNTEDAFNQAADYLEHFSADRKGAQTTELVSGLMKNAIDHMKPDTSVSPDLTAAALTALDQLLSLLLFRDEEATDVANVVRTVIQRSIYPSLAPALQNAANDGGVHLASLLPVPVLEPRELFESYYQRDQYRDLTPFYSGSLSLSVQVTTQQKKIHDLKDLIKLHKRSTTLHQDALRKNVLQRALVGWRLVVLSDRTTCRLRGQVADSEAAVKQLRKDYSTLHVSNTAAKRQNEQLQTFMRKELHTTTRLYETTKHIADKYRSVNEEMHSAFNAEHDVVLDDLQALIIVAQTNCGLWKDGLKTIHFGTADNEFENFNRARIAKSMEQLEEAGELSSMYGGLSSLEQWARCLVAPFPHAPDCIFMPHQPMVNTSPTDGLLSLREKAMVAGSLLLLLHSLSPGHVPFQKVNEAFLLQTLNLSVDNLLGFLEVMGLSGAAATLATWKKAKDTKMNWNILPSVLIQLQTRFGGTDPEVAFLPPKKDSDDWKLWKNTVEGYRRHQDSRLLSPSKAAAAARRKSSMSTTSDMSDQLEGTSNTGTGEDGTTSEQGGPVKGGPDEEPPVMEVVKGELEILVKRRNDLITSAKEAPKVQLALAEHWFDMYCESAQAERIIERLPTIPPTERKRALTFKVVPGALATNHKYANSLWRSLEADCLSVYCCHLRRVFSHYAGEVKDNKKGVSSLPITNVSSEDVRMSYEEFISLSQDCNLQSMRITSNHLYKHFYHCASPIPDGGGSPQLQQHEFLHLLIRLGLQVAGQEGDETEEEGQKRSIETLISRVLQYAHGNPTLHFSRQMNTDPVKEVIRSSDALLNKVYAHFSTIEDESSPSGKSLPESGFLKMCSDAKLLDNVCTIPALQHLFNKVPTQGASTKGGTLEFPVVGFSDFVELIGALSLFKVPAPFLSLDTKIKRFLEIHIQTLSLKGEGKKKEDGKK